MSAEAGVLMTWLPPIFEVRRSSWMVSRMWSRYLLVKMAIRVRRQSAWFIPTAPDSDRHPEVPALLRGPRRILTSSCMLASFEARFARTSGSAVGQRRVPLGFGGRGKGQKPGGQVMGSGGLLA